VIEKLRGELDVMRNRERSREEECEGLWVKCEVAMTEFKKNPLWWPFQEKIFVLSTDFKELKLNLDKMMLESQKWAEKRCYQNSSYDTVELVYSDDMGSLIGRLVSSAILYGRCRAYEQVTDMKEPFDRSKLKGYRSSYKKDHTLANNDFAIATFPWLDEFVADPSAHIEVLLSNKPSSLHRLVLSRTQIPLPTS
nr:hypothetical protein [Tanacetum cinerariifolium]